MEVKLAKSAGFCFGVNRAVNLVYELSDKEKVCTLGPIIHNTEMVKELEKDLLELIYNFIKNCEDTDCMCHHALDGAEV